MKKTKRRTDLANIYQKPSEAGHIEARDQGLVAVEGQAIRGSGSGGATNAKAAANCSQPLLVLATVQCPVAPQGSPELLAVLVLAVVQANLWGSAGCTLLLP